MSILRCMIFVLTLCTAGPSLLIAQTMEFAPERWIGDRCGWFSSEIPGKTIVWDPYKPRVKPRNTLWVFPLHIIRVDLE